MYLARVQIIFIAVFSFLLPFRAVAQPDSTLADSLLLQSLEEELASENTAIQSTGGAGRSLSISNPRISVIGDMQSWYDGQGEKPWGASLNEVEFAFISAVDPYARAEFYFTMEHDPETGENVAGIEEAFVQTLSLPAGLQLKAGRLKIPFGRVNPIHSHTYPFIELPVPLGNYFGEGLTADGFSVSWLVPQTLFYQDLELCLTDAPQESPVFTSGPGGYLVSGHLKNFWDLSENTTLELGFSGATGPNDSLTQTLLTGADLTLKWKPLQQNNYKSLTWQSEFIRSRIPLINQETVYALGAYSLLSWQFSKRWYVTGRYDYAQRPSGPQMTDQAVSLMLGWYATEFQKLELEGKRVEEAGRNPRLNLRLRWVFVIGSHGAHQY